MATKVYDTESISLIDGTRLTITPLKIIHLREFMEVFGMVKHAKNNDESIKILSYCAVIAMRQYYPDIKTLEDLEDNMDLATMYKILDVAGGISLSEPDSKKSSKKDEQGGSWEDLDLAKLEAEAFLLGIWKDYQELESSLSMPELLATLESKRELDYTEKKFLAAIQGVDLDKQAGKSNAWEEMKARVFSGGTAAGADDVLALQGVNAQKAGFGIGMGLDYERID